jgi:hypothetical protein|tara:strand:- start:586 stop:774 length:189 start_codon:yes stop_codon:yes gene_type:complete
MTTRDNALKALERVMADKGLAKSAVGRAIAGDPNFVDRLRSGKDITTKTLDEVAAFVLKNQQ